MRKAMNENPVVQVVLVGVLLIVVGFLFMTRIMGGNEAEPAPDAAAPATGVPAGVEAAEATAAGVPATDPSAAAPSSAPAVGAAPFEAGPGLPAPFVSAYENGDVVVLLVSRKSGVEDKRLRSEVQALGSRPGTSVFITDTHDVADYSRVAEGVDLNRAPALVVLKPRSGGGDGLPVATVSYGFRETDSVAQAVRDAVYKGKILPYSPG